MAIEEMDTSRENRTEEEIERLRDALEAETRQRLQVQRHLERANADFEEFVSIASHGLLESLRAIGSYSELIAETHAGRLDSDADLFFGRIHDGVAKMQSLLADMVEYWTTYGGGPRSSLADMEAVLRQAVLCAEKQI
jgi:light-regulated signal transduction histidine kinase (bacteriophytochrome)